MTNSQCRRRGVQGYSYPKSTIFIRVYLWLKVFHFEIGH